MRICVSVKFVMLIFSTDIKGDVVWAIDHIKYRLVVVLGIVMRTLFNYWCDVS